MEDHISSTLLPETQPTMVLYIKYMVSLRCKLVVKNELERLGLKFINVELGKVTILEDITPAQRQKMKTTLRKSGLELLDDDLARLIQQLKEVVIEMVYTSNVLPKNYTAYISKEIAYDYALLSDMFAEVRGITLQHYIILYKIEKVKELLVYDELSLSQIAAKTQYINVPQLYRQFKKITGLSPSFFKKLKKKRNQNIKNL